MNVNIPPALAEMGPLLSEFFETMIHKLNVNSHKDVIREDDIDGLIDKMLEEIQEFRHSRDHDFFDLNTLEELSDVSNFAFLLYAYLRSRGVRDVKERFIEEFYEIRPQEGRVYCKNTRSGSPLKIGDEVTGVIRNGRCYIRAQHSLSGATISMPRSDLVYWSCNGKWPINPIRYLNDDKMDDRIQNLDMIDPLPSNKKYPFVSQYQPKGREGNNNYGRYVYQRRHRFKLIRVGYWDTPEAAAREGIIAWKARIRENDHV